jgi:GR25 family glycosyltransferase involved in LPS biosynthesis
MRGYIIHLESAQEREPLLFNLQRDLSWNLLVLPASDGTAWAADPKIGKTHPWTRQPVSKGVLGCLASHLKILEGASKAEIAIAIFEDDCVLGADKETIEGFIKGAPEAWDILLLGANEYVNSAPSRGAYRCVNRFWGTHALLLRPQAVEAALRTFQESQREGICLPADWLYNEAIRRFDLTCYGPESPDLLCKQAVGFVSAITGKPRH